MARREREAAEHARSSEQRVSRSLEQLKSKNEELAAAMEELVSNQRSQEERWTSHDEQKRQLQAQLATAQQEAAHERSQRTQLQVDNERWGENLNKLGKALALHESNSARQEERVRVSEGLLEESRREAKAVGEAKERLDAEMGRMREDRDQVRGASAMQCAPHHSLSLSLTHRCAAGALCVRAAALHSL